MLALLLFVVAASASICHTGANWEIVCVHSGTTLVFDAATLELPEELQPHREVCISLGGHASIPTGACNLTPMGCQSLSCPAPCSPFCSCSIGANTYGNACRDLADSQVVEILKRTDLVFHLN